MILSFCLCLFSFSLQLPLFLSSYPLRTELLAACLNDTVPTSLSPSTVYVPCSSSCLCPISPNVIMEREKRYAPSFICKYSSQIPHHLPLLFAMVETIHSFLTVAAALLYPSSFTPVYNLEIGLSVPFYFLGLFYCFGMSLSLSLLPCCWFGHSAAFCITDLCP